MSISSTTTTTMAPAMLSANWLILHYQNKYQDRLLYHYFDRGVLVIDFLTKAGHVVRRKFDSPYSQHSYISYYYYDYDREMHEPYNFIFAREKF